MGAVVARNTEVAIWARDAATAAEINQRHTNEKYLPGAALPESLRAVKTVQEAADGIDVLVVGVPSHGFRGVLEQVKPHLRAGVPVVSLAKGLELDTRLRMTQIIEEILPGHPVGVLTGPNLAREIMAGQAAASVLAMDDDIILRELQALFGSGLFRVYTNTDIIGCELGGVLKNIIAIAVGMGDGQGAGDNTRAALITRGLAEATRLGVALGGQARTFAGLAGMGDMIATCISPQSRNRYVGVELGKGRGIQEIIGEMVMVAEGVKSVPTVVSLAEEHGVDTPIAREVYRVVIEGGTAKQAFRGLLRFATGKESEPG